MTNNIEYQGYFFTNYYLSSIQHGIQTAHCMSEICAHYLLEDYGYTKELDILKQYLKQDKTKIVLNGGNHASLEKLKYDIGYLADELHLPNCFFHEDAKSLNKILTCVGIIVPSTIYNNKLKDPSVLLNAPHPETRLAAILQSHHLAR